MQIACLQRQKVQAEFCAYCLHAAILYCYYYYSNTTQALVIAGVATGITPAVTVLGRRKPKAERSDPFKGSIDIIPRALIDRTCSWHATQASRDNPLRTVQRRRSLWCVRRLQDDASIAQKYPQSHCHLPVFNPSATVPHSGLAVSK
jgi:hypothetical protein